MPRQRRSWQEELDIIDRTMRSISSIVDPNELVRTYWDGIADLVPDSDHVAVSRRGVEPPDYLITRAARFTEHPNPWTERHRLPRLRGGLLGEIAYANKPVIIEDLPARLKSDDPAHFYLEGYQSLIALPQYDNGESLNVGVLLYRRGEHPEHESLPLMHWHAGLFGRGTQNLVLRNQLSQALGALDRELEVVGEIQRSLLPRDLPSIPGFELATDYITSARAGGDYYDFFPLPGGQWGVFIADVSGHGTPAAVLMAITHAIAHAEPGTHAPPATLLTYLHRRLARWYTRNGSFVTAFYAILDPATHTLTYSSAGHNPPRLVRAGRVLALDRAAAPPLGVEVEQEYPEASLRLERGDLMLLYTDGITEAMPSPRPGTRANLFGLERLDKAVVECGQGGAQACLERVKAAVEEFTGRAPPADDRTLIALRCL